MQCSLPSRTSPLRICGFTSLVLPILLAGMTRPARAAEQPAGAAVTEKARSALPAEATWPRFRGHNGTAVSEQMGIPVEWSESDYLWQTDLPGVGHSSPCVWGDRVFLNTAEDQGRRRVVLCLDAANGTILWRQAFNYNTYKKHEFNSYASSTPATDGQRVYVAFDDKRHYTLMAFDLDGRPVWDLGLGPFVSQHGAGVSPVVHDGIVYLANDQDGPSFVVAVDAKTGQPRWKVDRRYAEGATSYAAPFILERPGVPTEIVFASRADGITGFDARSGEKHWASEPFKHRTVSSPAHGLGMIFQTSGGGGQGYFLAALRPKGLDGVEVAWTREKQLPYVPTPIVYGENLFLWGDQGVLNCVDAATGQDLGTGRITGAGTFFGSPVCIDGKLYCISDRGDVCVVEATPELTLLGRNPLGDPSHSTPAVAGGRLFLRTYHKLFCIGTEDARAGQ